MWLCEFLFFVFVLGLSFFIILVTFFVTLGGTRASCVVVFMGICFRFCSGFVFFYSCDFCRTLGDCGVVYVCICLFV